MRTTLLCIAVLTAACSAAPKPFVVYNESFSPPGVPDVVWRSCYDSARQAATSPGTLSEFNKLPWQKAHCVLFEVADECALKMLELATKSGNRMMFSNYDVVDYEEAVDKSINACKELNDARMEVLRERLITQVRRQWRDDFRGLCGCKLTGT